jgi:uncharacterized protein YcbK (DUF882 family)
MLQHHIENNSEENDEVELSRRSFFGRLAVGAVLSIAMPGVVNAAKKADKNHKPTKKVKSGARLPKHAAGKSAKAGHQTSKLVSTKSVKTSKSNKTLGAKEQHLTYAKRGHSHSVKAARRAEQNSRVHTVYSGKKGHATVVSKQADSRYDLADRDEPIIQPAQKQLFVADHSRLVSHRDLTIQNPHTGDKLSLTYFEKGRYLTDALDEISFLLRDYRTDDVHPIDPELLDQLHDLKQILGLHQPFDVICGYRSPLTNAKLHAERSGVANNSFHMYGRAVDIRIERFDLRRIHNAALAMHRGGVGYYPSSKFIHLDTGTFRTWSL